MPEILGEIARREAIKNNNLYSVAMETFLVHIHTSYGIKYGINYAMKIKYFDNPLACMEQDITKQNKK